MVADSMKEYCTYENLFALTPFNIFTSEQNMQHTFIVQHFATFVRWNSAWKKTSTDKHIQRFLEVDTSYTFQIQKTLFIPSV